MVRFGQVSAPPPPRRAAVRCGAWALPYPKVLRSGRCGEEKGAHPGLVRPGPQGAGKGHSLNKRQCTRLTSRWSRLVASRGWRACAGARGIAVACKKRGRGRPVKCSSIHSRRVALRCGRSVAGRRVPAALQCSEHARERSSYGLLRNPPGPGALALSPESRAGGTGAASQVRASCAGRGQQAGRACRV